MAPAPPTELQPEPQAAAHGENGSGATTGETDIAARFRIGAEIGQGSFGTVYAAERIEDGEAVVVKKIHLDALSADDRAGALREAATLSQFNHANIIRYFESVYHDGARSCGSPGLSCYHACLVTRHVTKRFSIGCMN